MSYRTEVSPKQLEQQTTSAVRTQKVLPAKQKSRKLRHTTATSLEKMVVRPSKAILQQRPTAQLIFLRNEQEVFEMAFTFLKRLEGNQAEHLRLFQILSLNKTASLRSRTLESSNLSIKENLVPSITSSRSPTEIRQLHKRISINSFTSELSEQSIEPPLTEVSFDSPYKLTLRIVRLIFQNPSPFLVIHSLGLLLKYLQRTETLLTSSSSVKLLAVSTIISYKMNYDQQISGITAHYGSMMDFDSRKINQMEANFLQAIDFQTHIDKMQYYLLSEVVMTKKKLQ